MSILLGYRASILDFINNPAGKLQGSYRFYEDGLLLIRSGKIIASGAYSDLLKKYQPHKIIDYSGYLLLPGFIDTHIHFPQAEIIASFGEQLLEWLENYTFPAERQYHNFEYASKSADFFVHELLRNGTTTALVFCTVHKESVDALLTKAESLNLRLIAGKVLMDRNAPDYLLDTPESSYTDSKKLIEKWHGKGRLSYAITPRFAPTSSRQQLELAGRLRKEYPSTWLQTHLAENLNEINWVNELFPERSGYLDLYDHYDLVAKRSIFAHSIHLNDQEWEILQEREASIAHCPTSNLFLGSGLFKLAQARQHNIKVGLGTDIGAGTSFSPLQTLSETYKIQQLQGTKLTSFEAFYLATLGGAVALDLQDKIGSFNPGNEADFVVLDLETTPLMKMRIEKAKTLEEQLFILMILGDDRNIHATYSFGNLVYQNSF